MQRVGIPISSHIGGDVFESFTKLNDIISKNDGVRSFSVKTNSCYDSDAPVPEKTQTHLRITNNYHDINQIGESYIRCKWSMKVKVNTEITMHELGVKGKNQNDGQTEHECAPLRLFVGWKNANEAFRQLEVENNNIDCDYLQTEMAKESCAYSAYMPDEEKKSRRYAHSRWEDVEKGIPGPAGIYIDIRQTVLEDSYLGTAHLEKDGTIRAKADQLAADDNGRETEQQDYYDAGNVDKVFEFETVIPITDLLAFQAFEEFPGCLGDIVLKWYFTSESMVYAFCDPQAIEENERFWDTSSIYYAIDYHTNPNNNYCKWAYTRGFTQIGQPSLQPTDTSLENDGTSNNVAGFHRGDSLVSWQTISVEDLTLVSCYCDVYGYNVTQECKRNLAALFTPEHPMIIPAQHLDVKNMPKHNNAGLYDADFTYALHNVTDFVVVWPRTYKDLTCFYNPRLKDVQLKVDGKLYPTHKFERTDDYRFYQMMMNASDLDNYYEADQSYSHSLTAPIPEGWKNTCCPYDISTFLCTFQVERNTAGYCFDGLETGNLNVNIGLQYTNIDSWYSDEDRYKGVAPQIWFTRDTYWTCDNVNGLKYHKVGTPPQYASSED